MYIGVYTVYEKAVIGVIAHNPHIFHDFYGNNIFKFTAFGFTTNFWETQLGVKQDNSTCLRGRDVMEVSSKKTATRLTWTPDQKALVIYQVETVINRLIVIELYDMMQKLTQWYLG